MKKILENDKGFDESQNIKSVLKWTSKEKQVKPLVSVLMPIYNHPDYFEIALKSAVNQNCEFEYEIIVVDNNHEGSNTINYEIIRRINSSKVKYYLNEENIGSVNNWNRCILLAEGEYVTFCHDDDELLPTALNDLILSSLATGRKKAAIIGGMNLIDAKGDFITHSFNKKNKMRYYNLYDWFRGNITNGCGALFNRKCLLEVGGFCEKYSPCFDYALNVNYARFYGSFKLIKSTYNYRMSNQSGSANIYEAMANSYLTIQREMIPYLRIYPRWYLRLVVKSQYNIVKYVNEKTWGDSLESGNRVPIIDKIINASYFVLHKLLYYLKIE